MCNADFGFYVSGIEGSLKERRMAVCVTGEKGLHEGQGQFVSECGFLKERPMKITEACKLWFWFYTFVVKGRLSAIRKFTKA